MVGYKELEEIYIKNNTRILFGTRPNNIRVDREHTNFDFGCEKAKDAGSIQEHLRTRVTLSTFGHRHL